MNILSDLVKIVAAPVSVAASIASVPIRILAEPIGEVAKAAEALANDVKNALK